MAAPTNIMTAMYYEGNAGLMLNCHRIGYLPVDAKVLDLTYGRGLFWTIFRPPDLTTNDLKKKKSKAQHHYNVLALPKSWRDSFDVTVLDLPYVSVGGRKSTTVPDFQERFGLDTAPRSPAALHRLLIAPGIRAAARVTKPGGLVLQKCKNYISGGKFQPAVYWAYEAGRAAGLVLHDEVIPIMGTGPQPKLNRG